MVDVVIPFPALTPIAEQVKFAKLDDGDEYNREARFGAEDVYNFSSYPALFIFKVVVFDTRGRGLLLCERDA